MFSGSKSFRVRKATSTTNSVASSPAVVSRCTEGLNFAKASFTLSTEIGTSSSSSTSLPTRFRVIGKTAAVVSVGTGRAAGVTPFRITSILGISFHSLHHETFQLVFWCRAHRPDRFGTPLRDLFITGRSPHTWCRAHRPDRFGTPLRDLFTTGRSPHTWVSAFAAHLVEDLTPTGRYHPEAVLR